MDPLAPAGMTAFAERLSGARARSEHLVREDDELRPIAHGSAVLAAVNPHSPATGDVAIAE